MEIVTSIYGNCGLSYAGVAVLLCKSYCDITQCRFLVVRKCCVKSYKTWINKLTNKN